MPTTLLVVVVADGSVGCDCLCPIVRECVMVDCGFFGGVES